MTVSSSIIQTDMDIWNDNVFKGISSEFTEEAKRSGRTEIKHFNTVDEYKIWRFFQGLDDSRQTIEEELEDLVQ